MSFKLTDMPPMCAYHILGGDLVIKVFIGWTEKPFKNYIGALEALGASVEREKDAGCDMLLLPGGADIHPKHYSRPIAGATEIDEERDRFELEVFKRFYDSGRPILGICRGEQLINVALGGTLRQHIDGHGRLPDETDSTHTVLTDDEWLKRLYGGRFTVNSAHHQAVEELGEGLSVIARAEDGTVEAVRHASLPILGVQWHPERFAGGDVLLRAFLNDL